MPPSNNKSKNKRAQQPHDQADDVEAGRRDARMLRSQARNEEDVKIVKGDDAEETLEEPEKQRTKTMGDEGLVLPRRPGAVAISGPGGNVANTTATNDHDDNESVFVIPRASLVRDSSRDDETLETMEVVKATPLMERRASQGSAMTADTSDLTTGEKIQITAGDTVVLRRRWVCCWATITFLMVFGLVLVGVLLGHVLKRRNNNKSLRQPPPPSLCLDRNGNGICDPGLNNGGGNSSGRGGGSGSGGSGSGNNRNQNNRLRRVYG